MTGPTDEELLALWADLAINPDADGLAARVLPVLVARLAPFFPRVDPHDVETAAADAILALVKRPAAFDPGKSRLLSFLLMVARRDLLNRLKSEGRHHRGRIPWDSVALDPPGRNEERDDSPSFGTPALQAAIAALTDAERHVLELIRDGERQTVAFAHVLGVADRPAADQEAAVKRVKDRIKVRLKRAVEGSDG